MMLPFLCLLAGVLQVTVGDNAQLSKDFYNERTIYALPWNKQPGVPVLRDPFAAAEEALLGYSDSEGSAVPYKNCTDPPVKQFDHMGIAACQSEKYTKGCVSTTVPPFYECTCAPGYTCTFCNITTTPCALPDEAQFCNVGNTQSCTPNENDCEAPICICELGWTTDAEKVSKGTAKQCDQDIDECLSYPCKNGASCVNTPGSFHCSCAEGYGGPLCAYDAGCDGNKVPCAESATCAVQTWDGSPYGLCQCLAGTSGNAWVSCGKTNTARARAEGDPHFGNFDNVWSVTREYMGTCPVTLVRNCEHLPHITNFKVTLTASRECDIKSSGVSCIAFTYVEAYGHRIQITSRDTTSATIIVDDVVQNLPYSEIPGIDITAGPSGTYTVKTDFSLTVTVIAQGDNGAVTVWLARSASLTGKVCGMAGTMNGDPSMIKPDGSIASNAIDWGDSWAAENLGDYDSLGCILGKDIVSDTAQQYENQSWAAKNSPCRIFTDKNGPFMDCFDENIMNAATTQDYYKNCIYDIGAIRGSNASYVQDQACEIHLKPYAEKCRNKLNKKLLWRDGIDCKDPKCPEHSYFHDDASVCINTCKNPEAAQTCHTAEVQEACVCYEDYKEKYVLDNGKCVLLSDCGVTNNGLTFFNRSQLVDLLCSKDCLYLGDDEIGRNAGLFCKPLKCAEHASCTVTPQRMRDCVCDKGYFGDGRHSCRIPQRNCADLQQYYNVTTTGVSPIGIWSYLNVTRKVFCDMDTEGGGWTVIQRRVDALDFNKTWTEYASGFGDISGSFWYGLEMLHVLTMYNNSMTLRIDFEDCDGTKTYQKFENVKVSDVKSYYRMTFDNTYGTAGDAFDATIPTYVSPNAMGFSTFDNDHDAFQGINCALLYDSGWWHRACTTANVNGKYYPDCGGVGQVDAATWYTGESTAQPHVMKKIEMKIRPAVYPPTD